MITEVEISSPIIDPDDRLKMVGLFALLALHLNIFHSLDKKLTNKIWELCKKVYHFYFSGTPIVSNGNCAPGSRHNLARKNNVVSRTVHNGPNAPGGQIDGQEVGSSLGLKSSQLPAEQGPILSSRCKGLSPSSNPSWSRIVRQ